MLADDLYAFAWSAPMRELAAELELSDVGLKKLLARHGVAPPPQGYWNKVQAGKPVPTCPKAPPRRPGEIGRLRLDARFAKVLHPVLPISSEGPFASALVPEALDELYAQELEAIGRAAVPRTLDTPHKGLRGLIAKEKRRSEKAAASHWAWDQPKFETPLAKRRLRILNGLFLALSKRGHDGDVGEHDGELHARATVGDMGLGLEIEAASKYRSARQSSRIPPAADLPATTPLVLRLDPDFDRTGEQLWRDDDGGKLEEKIAPIAATIIVAGEAKFRRSLREAEERELQIRREQEKRRQEALAKLNRQRLQNLYRSGELLRQAQDIRTLVERVRHAVNGSSTNIDSRTLEAWERWALGEANKIDPICSGQFRDHLEEPTLEKLDQS